MIFRFGLLVLLASCGSPSLDQKGAQVSIVKTEPAECQYLGTAEADPGLDMDTAYVQLRNMCGSRGADSLVIDAIRRIKDDIIHHGRCYLCNKK